MIKYTIPAGEMLIKFDGDACVEPARVKNADQDIEHKKGKYGAEILDIYDNISVVPMLEAVS